MRDEPVFANQGIADILGHDGPDDSFEMRSSSDCPHRTEIERIAGYRRERLRGWGAPEIDAFKAVREDGSMVWPEAATTNQDWRHMLGTIRFAQKLSEDVLGIVVESFCRRVWTQLRCAASRA